MLWQRVPARALRIDHPRRELAEVLAFALLYVGASAGTALIVARWPHPVLGATGFVWDATYVVGFKLVLLLAAPIAWLAARRYRPADLIPGLVPGPRLAWTCGLSFLAGMVPNLGHLYAIAAHPDPLRIAAGIALALVSAGLPEELVFRGLIHSRIERVAGRLAGWVGTAALFTAWHLPSRLLLASGVEGRAGDLGSVLLGTGVPVFVLALVLGAAWDRWRNLPALVAAHWGIDALPAAAALVGIRF